MATGDISRYIKTFLDESRDLTESLVDNLLFLESAEESGRKELVNTVFRAFHTIKSNADGLGFKLIASISHDSETLLDKLRSGTGEPDRKAVDFLLHSVDTIVRHLESIQNTGIEDKQDPPAVAKPVHPGGSPSGRDVLFSKDFGLRILLAEGNLFERISLQGVLSPAGSCYFSINGRETIRAITAGMENGRRFDLLVLDLSLSRGNGFEVIRSIRELEKERDVPDIDALRIVALSPFLRSEALSAKVLSIGADCCLVKPVVDELLKAEVKRLFS